MSTTGAIRSLLGRRTVWERALGATPAAVPTPPTPDVSTGRLVRTGLGAGAGLVALSALSAAASAVRRRER